MSNRRPYKENSIGNCRKVLWWLIIRRGKSPLEIGKGIVERIYNKHKDYKNMAYL